MRVLAIDPGYERLGIAVVDGTGSSSDALIFSECFKTSSKLPFVERLDLIGQRIEELVSEHEPAALAIEKLFFNTNQKTAMRVSEVRGAILYLAKRAGLEIFEYTPLQIKIAVTGYGSSPKSQVMDMVPKLITIEKDITSDDEFDAVAVGITCLASSN